jgi:hypothetical protein
MTQEFHSSSVHVAFHSGRCDNPLTFESFAREHLVIQGRNSSNSVTESGTNFRVKFQDNFKGCADHVR